MWAILLAWLVDRAQAVMCAHNYGAPWNGIGAVIDVQDRKAAAPMAYRVLAPALLWPARLLKWPMLEAYEVIKIGCMAFGLWGVSVGWGLEVTFLTAALLPVTFKFDYWDWGIELGALGLAMSGRVELILVGVVLHALSKETWPLTPFTALLAGVPVMGVVWITAAGLMAWLYVRVVVGRRELYCERWMARRNWQELVESMRARPVFLSEMAMSLAVCALVIAAGVARVPGWPAAAVLVMAGWTMAVASETRVFAGALPWAAAVVVGWM